MKLLLLAFLFITAKAFALEAVVTVLEAPLLRAKSYDAPVVQYFRRGDVIKVHPALKNTTKYDDMAPPPGKYRELKKKLESLPEWQDPLFKDGKEHTAYIEDEFIPVVDRLGNIAYVLSEHIYVYFEDEREFAQIVPKKDPTDYRLQEPLPKNFPLFKPTGSRGQIFVGMSQAYNESYNYPDSVKTKSYANPVELYMSVLKQAPHDLRDRFYIGANWYFRGYENSYDFFDFRSAKEKYFQFAIGPLLSYDAYKGEKNRLNISYAINLIPINNLMITQELDDKKEQRVYRAINFSSRLGFQYHRKEIAEDMDFVLGTFMHYESPASFQAQDAGSNRNWWRKIGGEKYTTRGFFTLTGYLGVQAAY